ncbi:hypothetical protein [Nannocystis pusilla]|uniref:hypothetical protein n=1 Tax=Nannocystis pusilla TaxID=889268 RepID=UPI003DA1FBCC
MAIASHTRGHTPTSASAPASIPAVAAPRSAASPDSHQNSVGVAIHPPGRARATASAIGDRPSAPNSGSTCARNEANAITNTSPSSAWNSRATTGPESGEIQPKRPAGAALSVTRGRYEPMQPLTTARLDPHRALASPFPP